jgi:hypothetical protein
MWSGACLGKAFGTVRENRGRFASLPQLTAVRLCPALVGVAFKCVIRSCHHIRIAELPVCSSSGGKRVQFQNSYLTSMCVPSLSWQMTGLPFRGQHRKSDDVFRTGSGFLLRFN